MIHKTSPFCDMLKRMPAMQKAIQPGREIEAQLSGLNSAVGRVFLGQWSLSQDGPKQGGKPSACVLDPGTGMSVLKNRVKKGSSGTCNEEQGREVVMEKDPWLWVNTELLDDCEHRLARMPVTFTVHTCGCAQQTGVGGRSVQLFSVLAKESLGVPPQSYLQWL